MGLEKEYNQGHFSTGQISGLSSFTENLAHSATFDKLAEHVNNFFLIYEDYAFCIIKISLA